MKVPHTAWILPCCTQQHLWQNMPRRWPKLLVGPPSSQLGAGWCAGQQNPTWPRSPARKGGRGGTSRPLRAVLASCCPSEPEEFLLLMTARAPARKKEKQIWHKYICKNWFFYLSHTKDGALCISASLLIIGIFAIHGSGDIPTSDMLSCFIPLSSHTADASTHCLWTWLSKLWSYKRLSSMPQILISPAFFCHWDKSRLKDAKKEWATIAKGLLEKF